MDATINELRELIRRRGHLFPVYYFHGEVIDGSKRLIAATLERYPIAIVTLDAQEDAAQVLWRMHPAQAHERFARDLPLLAAARLLGASASAVAQLRRPAPKPRKYKSPKALTGFRARLPSELVDSWAELAAHYHITYSEGVSCLVRYAVDNPETFARWLTQLRLNGSRSGFKPSSGH